jgi:hypothetical protein
LVKNSLKPDERIQKILISTTSRFVGEYENSNDILLSHAWLNIGNSNIANRYDENPASRSSYVFVFRVEEPDEVKRVVLPNYAPTGDYICSYLSAFYGKRFDNHGPTENAGIYSTPDLSIYNTICTHRLPFNSHSIRSCAAVPLNLTHLSLIENLFTGKSVEDSPISQLETACKFYRQALQNAENDPETAYLHLITSGEILSGAFDYQKEELIDESTNLCLKEIEESLENGIKLSNQIRSRIFSVKNKFVLSICSLIDDQFFAHSESKNNFGIFTEQNFEKSIKSAYDLRSRYVHTGVHFGGWVKPDQQIDDIQHGQPVVDDKQLAKILAHAPKFCGLERTIRYCLIKLMGKCCGVDILKEINKLT